MIKYINIKIFTFILGLILGVSARAGDLPVPQGEEAKEGTNIESGKNSKDLPETNMETEKKADLPPPPEDMKELPPESKQNIENVNGKIIEAPSDVVMEKEPESPKNEIAPTPKKPGNKVTESLPENSESKDGKQNRARPREILKRHGEMVK